MITSIAAVLIGAFGALMLYLGSPNQHLLTRPLSSRLSVTAGLASLAMSLLLFGQIAGVATSAYLLLTLVMFIWSVPPLLFAWLRKRKEGRP